MTQSPPPSSDQEIDQLVAQTQNGDIEAFSLVYDRLVDRVYRYLYFRVNPEDLEDITEMVFIKVWQHIKKYKKETVPFMSWVFRIAHNLVIDHYRRHRSLRELKDDITDDRLDVDPKHLTERTFNEAIIKKALKELKATYQQVIVLRFINELSVLETASVMKLRSSVVRVLQFRALQALKKILLSMGIK